MAQPQERWFDAPTAGEAPDLPPDLMSGKHARVLRNFLVHHPGRIVPRGNIGGPTSTIDTGDLSSSVGAPMGPHYTVNDDIIISYKDPTASPTVDTWRVPINKPTSAGQLTQPVLGSQSARQVDLPTGFVADIANSEARRISGWRTAHLGGNNYTNAYGGTSTAVVTGVAQETFVIKNTPAGGVLLTNGPKFIQDVFAHLGRIWVAAATDPGGTNYEPNGLYYTNPGGTTVLTNVVADWQDPVTGALNRIAIGDPIDSDFVVALGRAAGHLVVFLRNAVWILYGTAPANLVLRQLRTLHGCVDARSVAVVDNGVYFASQRGYEFFDGEDFHLVSEAVSDTWLEFSNRGPAASTINHSYIVAEPLWNDYLFLSLGTQPHAANQTDGAERNWLLHTPSGAWTSIASGISSLGLSAAGAFNRAVRTGGYTTLWGASKFARADKLTYGVDATVGSTDRNTSTGFDVPLLWTTRLDNLSGRWLTSTLHAATVDYRQNYVTADPPDLDPWGTLTAADGSGATLLVSQALPGFDPSGAPTRARPTSTPKPEANRGDISFTLTSTIGSSSTKRSAVLNVYGLGVQYLPGRERRTLGT